MADDRLLITIEGKDGVSKTFVAVSKSADAAGKSVETAGKTGGAAMKNLAAETEKTAMSAKELEDRYTKVGATIGTAIGVVSKLGASYRDQRLDLQSLEAQYGSSADAVIDFTEAIQDSMNQSNDAARDSALVFATLYRNYEFGEQQVLALMERTADVSAARGRSMTETSQMIQNALRGEAEYIEQIGVTLNDTYVASEYAARGLGNWNTLTDEAAKAQFRYILLLEQTADTQGRAAEEADRAGGTMRRFINDMQDAGQTLGGLAGPAGEMAAEFSQIAIGLPVIAGGLGKVAGAARNSTIAMRAFSLALGPVGVLTVGIGLLTGAFLQNRKEAAEAAEVIATLKDQYLDLKVAADAAGDTGDVATEARLNQLRHQSESVRAEADLIVKTMEDASQFKLFGVDYDRDAWFQLKEDYEMNTEESALFAESQRILGAALQDTGIDGQKLAADMDALYMRFVRQEITLDQYILLFADMADSTSEYRVEIDDLSSVQERLNAAFKEGAVSAVDLGLASNFAVSGIENLHRETRVYVDEAQEAANATLLLEVAIAKLATQGTVWGVTTNYIAGDLKELAIYTEQVERASTGLGASLNTSTVPFVQDMKLLEETLAGILELTNNADITSQLNMTSAASEASLLAENITDAAGAIDDLFRAIVGNTNALGSQMQGIKDWSDDLIGDPGVWAEIDDLYNEGRISLEKYNEAQQAQVDITNSNATIQRDLLAIQAAQAPIIASNTQGLAAYIEELRKMNDGIDDTATGAQDQLAALALMDSGYQSQLLQVMQLADSLDDLGPSGEAAFTSMIDGMVALDPAMAAVLEKVGYIENVARDPSGKVLSYDVSIDGADGATSEIEILNGSIVELTRVLGEIHGIEVNIPINAEDNASDVIRTVRESRDDFDGSTATGILNADGSPAIGSIGIVDESLRGLDAQSATVDVYANDMASGVLANLAASWGGTIATSWIDVYTRNLPGTAAGGVVGYAQGGVITELAEAGSEIVHFASGGSAYVGQRGVYELSPGDYVMPHNQVAGNSYGGITIDFSGAVFNNTSRQEMDQWADSHLVPAIVDAITDERRGQVRI